MFSFLLLLSFVFIYYFILCWFRNLSCINIITTVLRMLIASVYNFIVYVFNFVFISYFRVMSKVRKTSFPARDCGEKDASLFITDSEKFSRVRVPVSSHNDSIYLYTNIFIFFTFHSFASTRRKIATFYFTLSILNLRLFRFRDLMAVLQWCSRQQAVANFHGGRTPYLGAQPGLAPGVPWAEAPAPRPRPCPSLRPHLHPLHCRHRPTPPPPCR